MYGKALENVCIHEKKSRWGKSITFFLSRSLEQQQRHIVRLCFFVMLFILVCLLARLPSSFYCMRAKERESEESE
jgi:hypothetical protein